MSGAAEGAASEPLLEMKIRELTREELPDLWKIDRAELVNHVYHHRDGELVLVPEFYDTRGWPPGEPELYTPLLLDAVDAGGTCYAACEGEELIGAAVLEGRFIGPEQDRLQLKFLHVSQQHRQSGLGRMLFEKAAEKAKERGARRLYISATPTENTVQFYLRRGCRVAEWLDPDLFALEPEDIHLDLELQ